MDAQVIKNQFKIVAQKSYLQIDTNRDFERPRLKRGTKRVVLLAWPVDLGPFQTLSGHKKTIQKLCRSGLASNPSFAAPYSLEAPNCAAPCSTVVLKAVKFHMSDGHKPASRRLNDENE